MASKGRIKASLFVTCLVDQLFPQVGEEAVRVLRRVGVEVDFPPGQTCCGQVAFNAGHQREGREAARRLLRALQGSDYVVAPSGSCVAMVRTQYPTLFQQEPSALAEAQALGHRLFELSEFLVEVLGVTDMGARYRGKVAYHPSCHLLRTLGISQAPQSLIQAVQGVEVVALEQADVCCGFGGAFAIKYPHISRAILEEKLRHLVESGADTLVSCDTGCLMHIGGAISRRGIPIRAMHIAELLAQE